jgi:hypothetical protein
MMEEWHALKKAEADAHPSVHVVVIEFGIGKRHAGNWRNV